MGAGVSAGENNDDLIDNLIEANYIKTSWVERVFRAVDRGAYFLPDPPADAYRDVAWKNGNFHISAPCIYSEVMEGLKLRPGLSFLNLGSGTGYLNTVAGLILGCYGLNHGIELHEDVIQYAYTRLEAFKKHSGAMDEYDFCEPKFMQGNCLSLVSGYHLYDRVYCGAACPEKYLSHIQNLIKVGGILVIPINERLVEMRRVTETSWSTQYLLPVSFTNLVKPEHGSEEIVPLFDIEPLTLQELCRATIRNLLRKTIETEHPNVKNMKKPRKLLKKEKSVKRDNRNGRKTAPKTSEELLNFFLLTIARKKKRVNVAPALYHEHSSSSNNDDSDGPSSDSDESLGDRLETLQEAVDFWDKKTSQNNASTSNCTESDVASSSKQNIEESEVESKVIVHREAEGRSQRNESETENKVSYNITIEPMVLEEVDKNEENGTVECKNRNKFDSGLGDELISELPVDMVEAISSISCSSDDDQGNKRCKRSLKEKDKRLSSKWRKLDRVDVQKKCDSEDSTDNEDKSDSEYVEAMNQMKMYISPYSVHMKNKIQQLPLPSNVKNFLNFHREF